MIIRFKASKFFGWFSLAKFFCLMLGRFFHLATLATGYVAMFERFSSLEALKQALGLFRFYGAPTQKFSPIITSLFFFVGGGVVNLF